VCGDLAIGEVFGYVSVGMHEEARLGAVFARRRAITAQD
jgi:hypothetical protein